MSPRVLIRVFFDLISVLISDLISVLVDWDENCEGTEGEKGKRALFRNLNKL